MRRERIGHGAASQHQIDRRSGRAGCWMPLESFVVERGPGALSINEIITRAGLAKRYFYESFGNLDQLVDTLFTEVRTDAFARMEGLSSVGGIGASPRHVAEHLVAIFVDNPDYVRLLLEPFTRPGGGGAARERLIHDGVALKGTLGMENSSEDEFRILAHAVSGALTSILMAWHGGLLQIERDELCERVTVLITRMLEC